MIKKSFVVILSLSIIYWGCADEETTPNQPTDNFDREVMLTNWADNIIIPAYNAYFQDLTQLKTNTEAFVSNTDQANLVSLKESWLTAYNSWQKVSMFEIGKAEELTLRDFTNIYPTSTTKIEEALISGNYNLTLPSSRDQQGFPAIDYLLFGNESEAAILSEFQQNETYKSYLIDLVNRLYLLTETVVNDWENGYRDAFVSKNGSDANSSVNKLVNDYMFYYEKALRAGKVGIPAGVFSATTLPDRVEAYYASNVSKQLLQTSLNATVNFFNGQHFDGTSSGTSLNDYLAYLNNSTNSDLEPLGNAINAQFELANIAITDLDDNFATQIENDNSALQTVFDELQKNVILMKVDMFQALNIRVDFVDADGD